MKRYIATILCAVTATISYARGDEAVYEKLYTSYTLAADGSQQFRRVAELRLDTHTSFNSIFGETFIVYDPAFQKLTINEAYTRQADGTVVRLPDNAVNESLPYEAADAPAYNGLREAVITHTGLEIGATVYLDYTLSTAAGFYPELEVCETLPQYAASVRDRRIEITLPEGRELRYDPAIKPRRNGDTYTWSFRNLPACYDEGHTPQNGEGRAVLCATTFASTADALRRIAPRTRDILKIPCLAADTPEKTAEAYAAYMASHTAPCGVTPRMAGYRYRAGGDVLASAYGTELERCALLAQMLSSEGIDAETVAVYPASHAMKMLRDIKRFAVKIGTGDRVRYVSASGAPVDLAQRSDRDEVYTLDGERIPFAPYSKNTVAEADMDIEGNGVTTRSTVTSSTADSKPLSDTGSSGTLANNGGYRIIDLPLFGSAALWNIAPLGTERSGYFEMPYACSDEAVYRITTDGKILTESKELRIDNAVGSLLLKIEVDGGKATVTRNVTIRKTIVPPKEWRDAREILTALAEDTYRQLIIK